MLTDRMGSEASTPRQLTPVVGLALFLLSAASLTFEINLSRLFSVSQFYHFAFMTVSIALLGFGASGTALAIFPGLSRRSPEISLAGYSLAAGLSMLAAYALTNQLPFDSFSIAWERRQVYILVLHYVALALPFFFTGLAVGCLLTAYQGAAGKTYAVNLFGSALGCILALLAPGLLGGEGTVVLSCGLAGLAAGCCTLGRAASRERFLRASRLLAAVLLGFALFYIGLRLTNHDPLPGLQLSISPYKGLSYALQYPGSQVVYRKWNAYSRIDLVQSAGIHSFPGLSYRYLQPLPAQDGLFVDGDELSPVTAPNSDLSFSAYMPSAIAFQMRPEADTLVLEPRGGQDILVALAQGASRVTAVEVNPLIVAAAGDVYTQPRIRVVLESGRSYLKASTERYDIILLSLASSYHPVRSGAYSLAEDYRYTAEAFQDALASLTPQGILVVTRWLQTPPSECLRAFALALTALERSGGDPRQQIVALRGYNTGTLLVKRSPFNQQELRQIRMFANSRAFDLTYAPDIQPGEVNQYNILPEPVYYQAFQALLTAQPHQAFYASYPFDVTPPTDDHPFFSHFFKWSQARQVFAELGKTWQPFGGAGYFVILALLVLALFLAALLIVLPVGVAHYWRVKGKGSTAPSRAPLSPLIYFILIGLGYLLVEVPLIQGYILYLGHPSYAMTAVLFSLLLFSGLGSRFSDRVRPRQALGILALTILIAPILLGLLFRQTLGLPLVYRLIFGFLALAPLGFLMGIPFPAGIGWVSASYSQPVEDQKGFPLIPWMWGANGAASVVAAVLAALLALTFGYSWVLRTGALCYAGAWITLILVRSRRDRRSLL